MNRAYSGKYRYLLVCLCVLSLVSLSSYSTAFWGFWAHRYINKMAIHRLPIEMAPFYKQHLDFISESAVNPDKRRYAVVGEGEKHFIDLDAYDNIDDLPLQWEDAVQQFGEDTLRKHGIAPWNIQQVVKQLTKAFKNHDYPRILRLSADLGHYVGDIHVPLHTTKNYNGQLTGQEGIHAFWESRLPELLAQEYSFWIGPISYIDDVPTAVWQATLRSHAACDSVLRFEKELSEQWKASEKYSYEVRLNQNVKMHSVEFAKAYHQLLDGQVERQMRAAIQMIGNLWYTCWVDAGQPQLPSSITVEPTPMSLTTSADTARILRKRFSNRNEIDD